MILKRTLYLAYYFKQMKWDVLTKFLKYTSKNTGNLQICLFFSSIRDVYKYNISILEYFQFSFYKLSKDKKLLWAGTGTMYEYQRQANPIDKREILDDKRLFYKNYREFFVHELYTQDELRSDKVFLKEVLSQNNRLVLKEANGKCGAGVKVIDSVEFNEDSILEFMKSNNFDILETYIRQHSDIQKLAPTAVNTIRIFTQIRKNGEYEILGCRMRISVNSSVDNMAAGNLAAPVDEKTGIITGPGVYSDITKKPESVHPVTGVSIVGFQVPYWDKILKMIEKASLKHLQNRSIGWDIVVTETGPGLIEGNHDWCKLVWQLPVNEGLKYRLDV